MILFPGVLLYNGTITLNSWFAYIKITLLNFLVYRPLLPGKCNNLN